MRRTLQSKGARLAAHALDSANGMPLEPCCRQAVQEPMHTVSNWRSEEWQQALREMATQPRIGPSAGQGRVQQEKGELMHKVAHIRYVPRHVSRVLMQSCCPDVLKSADG